MASDPSAPTPLVPDPPDSSALEDPDPDPDPEWWQDAEEVWWIKSKETSYNGRPAVEPDSPPAKSNRVGPDPQQTATSSASGTAPMGDGHPDLPDATEGGTGSPEWLPDAD